MSVHIMSEVWSYSRAAGNLRLILLAIADCADHETRTAYPSVSALMRKTLLSERTVQASIRKLVEIGELAVETGGGRRKRNLYTVQKLRGMPDKETPQLTTLNPAEHDAETPQNLPPLLTRNVILNVKEPSSADGSKGNGKFVLPDWIPLDAWDGWVEMRKRSRVANTDRALALTVKRLGELREQGHDPAAVLDQSVQRGWRGVFPLKPDYDAGRGGNGARPSKLERMATAIRKFDGENRG
jgi:hypothetical protein